MPHDDRNQDHQIIVNGVPMSRRDYRRSQRAAAKNREIEEMIAGGAVESKTRGQSPPAREIRKTNGLNREVLRDADGEIVALIKNPVGRPRVVMTEDQKAEFLEYIKLGHSNNSICQLMGMSNRVIPNTTDADPEFAEQVKMFKDARTEFCEAVMYRAVRADQEDLADPEAALEYIRMVRGRDHNKAQLMVQRREIKLKQQMIARRMGTESRDDEMNVNNLDRAEFAEFSNLMDAVKSGGKDGDPLSKEEMTRFGILMAKCLGGSPKMIGG